MIRWFLDLLFPDPAPRPHKPERKFAILGANLYVTNEEGEAEEVAVLDGPLWLREWIEKQPVPDEAP